MSPASARRSPPPAGPAGRGTARRRPASSPSDPEQPRRRSSGSRAASPSWRAAPPACAMVVARVVRVALLGARPRGVEQLLARRAVASATASNGCCVVFCSGITHLPSSPRALAACGRGVDLGRRQARRARPCSPTTSAPSLAAASSWLMNFALERRVLLVQLLEPRLVGVRQPGARVHELLVVVLDAGAAIRGRASASRAGRRRASIAREELGVQEDRVLSARRASARRLPAASAASVRCSPTPAR